MRILALLLILVLCTGAATRSFDGTDDEISWGNNLDITTGDQTYCVWANTNEDAGADVMLAKKQGAGASNAGTALFQGTADNPRCIVSDGTTQQDTGATGTDIDGAWYHLCCTWESTGDDAIVYVNGVQDSSDTTGTVGSLTNAANLKTGEDGNDLNDMNGELGYATQHGRVLATWEMNQLRWLPGTIAGSLGGFWPLWGASTEQDLGGAGITGTVTGATTSTDGPPVSFGMGMPL